AGLLMRAPETFMQRLRDDQSPTDNNSTYQRIGAGGSCSQGCQLQAELHIRIVFKHPCKDKDSSYFGIVVVRLPYFSLSARMTNTIRFFESQYVAGLYGLYDAHEAKSLLFYIVSELMGYRLSDYDHRKDQPLSQLTQGRLYEVLSELEKRRPLQYI